MNRAGRKSKTCKFETILYFTIKLLYESKTNSFFQYVFNKIENIYYISVTHASKT